MSGETIQLAQGSYQLQAVLAQSTYGTVWRAQGPQGPVALKLVHVARMRQAAAELHQHWRHAAQKEIVFLRALSPWDERHIVRLLDDGWHEGMPVMALELMDCNLQQYVSKQSAAYADKPAMPLERSLNWLAQINQALAKVHQYGWRYLDLKPANLLLTADARCLKLADFGTNRRQAQPHPYRGTPNWQAPEQFYPSGENRLGQVYSTSSRTDYFALGALFFYLVSGGMGLRFGRLCLETLQNNLADGAGGLPRLPLAQAAPQTLYADEADLFWQVIAHAHSSALADQSLDLLQQLLAADPARRPPHALAIARALDGLLACVARSTRAEWVN
jgi:serine/threonine protein kinase